MENLQDCLNADDNAVDENAAQEVATASKTASSASFHDLHSSTATTSKTAEDSDYKPDDNSDDSEFENESVDAAIRLPKTNKMTKK